MPLQERSQRSEMPSATPERRESGTTIGFAVACGPNRDWNVITPAGYDPVTLYHWLWWKHRCHEGSPDDFQRLFEAVMKRAKPEFMQIRPYGKIGDRKCDGLYFQEGVVFQVYSPDELKQSEVQARSRRTSPVP
jgi:hypothetical protein